MPFWFQVLAPTPEASLSGEARVVASAPTRTSSAKASKSILRDDIRDAELLLTAFRTLLIIALGIAPPLMKTIDITIAEAYSPWSLGLMAIAGVYNITMGVACLFPARFGVRRPVVLAMDTTLITAWIFLSDRPEFASFYVIVVVVAAMWFRVLGGIVAATVCNFLFLFLWFRNAAEAPPAGIEPFTVQMLVTSVLLFVVGALAGYIAEAQERERGKRLERDLLITSYQHELEVSGELQPLLIARPDISTPFDFGLAFRSARAVGGGDYLDVLALPDGRVLACIADVSGKSVRAQARVPLLKYSLRALAPLHPDPVELMAHLKTTLAPDLSPELYIALCLITFDASSKTLQWCNAGHIPPFLIRANGDVVELETTCPPLGLWPEIEPVGKRSSFVPGDAVLMATDGLSDALSFGGGVDGEAQVRLLTPRLIGENALRAPEAAQKLVELAQAALENNSFVARNFTMGNELAEPRAYADDVAVLIARFPLQLAS